MPYAPYTGSELPTIVNVAKRLDPDGSIADIAELLTQANPIIGDVPMVEGNLPTGHRVTVRADLPTPTWRLLNYGVRPTKSNTTQVDETIGMLEDYSEVDKDLAMLNGNTAQFRLSEDKPHIESMSNTMASTIFYGDALTYPNRFHGLAPRYAATTVSNTKPTANTNSDYLKHVILAGGSGSDCTSMWYICWGDDSVFGIYPKGSKVGLMSEDMGEVTLFDNDGGRFQGYRSHYQWKMGLVVKDWRYIVRIANIDLGEIDTAANQKNLYTAMIKATHTVPGSRRGIFYCAPAVMAILDLAAVEKGNAALGYREIFGQEVLSFRGIPIKQCDALLETETALS